jgi:hypothetical protein
VRRSTAAVLATAAVATTVAGIVSGAVDSAVRAGVAVSGKGDPLDVRRIRARDLRGMTEGQWLAWPNRRQKMPVCSTFGVQLAADLPCAISPGSRREAGGRLRQECQQKIAICRMFSAGATGLEPATSGVTDRYGLDRHSRLPPGITR